MVEADAEIDHRLDPERAVVANSYLGPILSTYLSRLERRLIEQQFRGALLIMHSGGGLLPTQTAVARLEP